MYLFFLPQIQIKTQRYQTICQVSHFWLDINSLKPSDAYIHVWTGSSLMRVISIWLWGDSPELVLNTDVLWSIAKIPQYFSPIPHNAPFCNRNVHMCVHFCYRMVHYGIWDDVLWCLCNRSIGPMDTLFSGIWSKIQKSCAIKVLL